MFFLRLLDNISKERAELHILNEWLREMGMTTIMTVKRSPEGTYEFLEYMANCVICLDQRVFEQITTRRMRVVKYRGSIYGRNEYPFGITHEGLRIIPVKDTMVTLGANSPINGRLIEIGNGGGVILVSAA